jgi:hypothetical protein
MVGIYRRLRNEDVCAQNISESNLAVWVNVNGAWENFTVTELNRILEWVNELAAYIELDKTHNHSAHDDWLALIESIRKIVW